MYQPHPEAIIISCFFNPTNSEYRLKAFHEFYSRIAHLNHRIIECVIGDGVPQLPANDNIKVVHTPNLLWHKEALLNNLIAELPAVYKYIFWLDADIIFTNRLWIEDAVHLLKEKNLIQPFEYCIHLEKDEVNFPNNPDFYRHLAKYDFCERKRIWASFCSHPRGKHGHVGLAWGARREVLDRVPLYDKALIGGADHILAHAAIGEIPSDCLTGPIPGNHDALIEWSEKFYKAVMGQIGFIYGDIYHLWHGNPEKRQYASRLSHTPKLNEINLKDENGLYITNNGDDQFIRDYFKEKESE